MALTSADGDYSFETALNEHPGRWTLEVKHVNTGVTVSWPFDVAGMNLNGGQPAKGN